MTSGKTYFQLGQTSLKTSLPIAQEVFVRRDTKADDDERVCHVPIPRFASHVPGFRIYNLYSLCPLRVIHFSLGRLRCPRFSKWRSGDKYAYLSNGVHQMYQSFREGKLESEAMRILKRFRQCFHKFGALLERLWRPDLTADDEHIMVEAAQ